MEQLDTLMSQMQEEADKLIFKICTQRSKNIDKAGRLTGCKERQTTERPTPLDIPFARYVAADHDPPLPVQGTKIQPFGGPTMKVTAILATRIVGSYSINVELASIYHTAFHCIPIEAKSADPGGTGRGLRRRCPDGSPSPTSWTRSVSVEKPASTHPGTGHQYLGIAGNNINQLQSLAKPA